jgi:hypothetical protein
MADGYARATSTFGAALGIGGPRLLQEISEHRAAEGPADERCHHRLNTARSRSAQTKWHPYPLDDRALKRAAIMRCRGNGAG